MKRTHWQILIGLFLVSLVGCSFLAASSTAAKLKPGQSIKLIDTDGDGDKDVAIIVTRNATTGEVTPVLKDGQPVVLEGSIEMLKNADSTDAALMSVTTALTLLGLPFAGIAGVLLRTFRPTRKMAESKLMLTELVNEIQKWREHKDGSLRQPFDSYMSGNQSGLLKATITRIKDATPAG